MHILTIYLANNLWKQNYFTLLFIYNSPTHNVNTLPKIIGLSLPLVTLKTFGSIISSPFLSFSSLEKQYFFFHLVLNNQFYLLFQSNTFLNLYNTLLPMMYL